ncbi:MULTISPECIES: TldD/PmbA family protein [unclassified Pseudomonas]|uniref:TldD/PmbA family protein n=1 Tax=unclassified Pseudomonas TaxID=196821 RepID=UPI0021C5F027|nr:MULTISPECIES: metallopeptidase TldD-related protein [unclassified Pseudomonas]MCU1730373.1 metallopeptidase TldD-related protein [Pseudomonas sp. 20P_3.2_Bac4]MCU1746342.1 metallopeptidase TldD-related protein [Pseudomonas sp. 20P_3.2_Bac5]
MAASFLQNFQALVAWLRDNVNAPEQFTLSYAGEHSQFIRFNHARVRQAGDVHQSSASLKLIADGRQAELNLTLSGDADIDRQRLGEALAQLRQTLPLIPPDPYLLLNDSAWESHDQQEQPLPDSASVLKQIEAGAGDLDLVGIYAAGPICRGFASSSGAFGWHQANSFNFDWSLFHTNGQAVKANYAGQVWDDELFARRLAQAREQLDYLGRPLKTLAPGQYRAYLAPAALEEIVGMLGWGGFSAQSIANKHSPLQRLYSGEASLSPLVNLAEQVSGSLSPAFSEEGYPRSDLRLIDQGRALEQLTNARSAAEFQRQANGADPWESPSALSMAGGELAEADVLAQLGTGLYISNLWYLNYSDLPAARMTGLTRFACFWVEDGQIHAPVSTMRFDDSVYSLLGTQLEALTQERELMLSTSTYGQRQTGSNHLPGALVKRLTLTL